MKMVYRIGAGLVVMALFLSAAVPAQAVSKDFLLKSKFHGMIMLGFGGFLVKEAIDSKKEGSNAYDAYIKAGTSSTAREFYDDSKRHDTRAAVLGVAGGVSILFAMHLFMKDEDELPLPKMQRGIIEVKGVSLDVKGDMFQRKMQVLLKKGF